MISKQNRYRPNQSFIKAKFERKANSIKSVNKTMNKRKGICL